jgi:hypothetical protein
VTSIGQPWSEPTLWPEDTPASPSASPAVEKEKMIPDTFGPFSPSAFAYFDPAMHCWRTLQGTLVSDSDRFSQTWPRSGMTQDGIAYQLPPSAPRIFATGSSLWPTPVASDWKNSGFPPAAANWDSLPGKLMKRGLAKSGDGHLNPTWVEWLMGFPEGWTDLEHSETP